MVRSHPDPLILLSLKNLTTLELELKAAQQNLYLAEKALEEFQALPENNEFDSLEEASSEMLCLIKQKRIAK